MVTVLKVADIIKNHVVTTKRGAPFCGDVAMILTNLPRASSPDTSEMWTIDLTIGEGLGARVVRIDLQPVLSKSDARDQPKFLGRLPSQLVWFEDRIFMSERALLSESECEEIVLRVKNYCTWNGRNFLI